MLKMQLKYRFSATLLVGIVLSTIACGRAQDKSSPYALVNDANRLLVQGAHEKAAEKAQQAGEAAGDSPEILQRAAEILYRAGASKQSLTFFNRVVELEPDFAPSNWQRGIALCSCGEWEAGAKQFKIHHDVNPDDVENSAWYFLCVAKTKGMEAARETVIPSRGDSRQPMMSVLKMLQGSLEPAEVAQAAVDNTPEGTSARKSAQFYADLYIGLYYDCLDDAAQAQKFLKRSLTYGIDGYMADTARVYLADRFEPRQKDAPSEK